MKERRRCLCSDLTASNTALAVIYIYSYVILTREVLLTINIIYFYYNNIYNDKNDIATVSMLLVKAVARVGRGQGMVN